MAVAPVDVFFIGFPGNKFSGQIVPAILDLVDQFFQTEPVPAQ